MKSETKQQDKDFRFCLMTLLSRSLRLKPITQVGETSVQNFH